MRKLFVVILSLFVLTISAQSNSGKNQSRKYSEEQVELFIREVFQDKADELVFKSSGGRLEMITDFLQNRTSVVYAPEYRGKKFKALFDFKLSNKYNPKLERDLKVSVSSFNPLKYEIPMFPKNKELYRIGNTDYLLIITPITAIN
ncbi:hypothetical protein FLJC2902T_30560 [Flavobacterium limnosediminis JC2902]|uniref:Uncharacterized protein n=1 Tax=Flavobacterium limnosediminis JC2902 TaxID=1341181 RepID=V6SH03_9FLAO|nr:hypothetical protein [Flavobacterium limnosediminis]ESU25861.1 hypothetical protein FLJC2902T_30560 [Flavobacterium limnosediminis JC2902]